MTTSQPIGAAGRRSRGRSGGRAARAAALLLAGALGAAPAGATPLLSEVLYDAEGADAGAVFVELFGPAGSSLEGLSLEGVNGSDGSVTVTVPLSGSFPEDGLFVVAAGEAAAPGADQIADFDLQNGPDSVQLLGPEGVVDALGYGSFGAGDVFAGEGDPAPDAPAGTSLARRFANRDSDDNAADFVLTSPPTPGSAPLAAIPEPGAAGLLGVGLLGLAGLGRPGARGAPAERAGHSMRCGRAERPLQG